MTSENIDELFARTLSGDYDDDAPWEAVRTLRQIGSRDVFDRAAEWCGSENPLQRARGADVLAQLGKTANHCSNSFPEESYDVVSRMLRREKDQQPLRAAIAALGHLDNSSAVPLIIENQFQFHPSAEVRFSVAFAFGAFPNDPHAIALLLLLMEDPDDDVRDWATFGLGVLSDSNCDEICDALFRRISDSNQDVREEAMVGLGKRKDKRVLPALIVELQQPSMTYRVIDAAREMLGMEEDRKDWSGDDYVAALRERFPL